MIVEERKSLLSYNTFGIDVSANYFAEIKTIYHFQELRENAKTKNQPWLILGGGSNILFTRDFDGLVIKNSLSGISIIKEDAWHYWVRAAAGEIWHQLVLFCVAHNLAGIENLSLIPGQVGAAPMQNIGAYGVEIEETCEEVEAISLASGERAVLQQFPV
jgi:UDP-N-acetylmuramate dehydrogenase